MTLNGTMSEESPGVFRVQDAFVIIEGSILENLSAAAHQSPRRRARILCHPSGSSPVQEMFILIDQNSYVCPHRHRTRSESLHVLRGEATIFLFSEHGDVVNRVAIGALESKRPFFYRMPPGLYHSLKVHSDALLFHEVVEGPYDPTDTEYAPWAPPEGNHEVGLSYLEGLESAP